MSTRAGGVHPVHVARVESGTANVTIATLIAFALPRDVLEVSSVAAAHRKGSCDCGDQGGG